MLTDKEIYKLWLSQVPGPKYLRPVRWAEISSVIDSKGVKSVIEFGSGVSTLLFANKGVSLVSFETDPKYMGMVKRMLKSTPNLADTSNVTFRYWRNSTIREVGSFDLAFVDGVLPRVIQLDFAKSCSPLIAIDDYGPRMKNLFKPQLEGYTRINSDSTLMAIFTR